MEDEFCQIESGLFYPEINLNKCESDGRCVKVCPKNVLEMNEISESEYKNLSFIGKLKTKAHGRIKVFAVRAEDCKACGECVKICPEKAIKLVKAV